MIKNVPLYNMYLYDPSFGVPLKYLIVVLNQIFDKKIVVGYQMNKLLEILNLSSIYQTRDIMVNEDIGVSQTSSNLAKTFFDINLDPYFRSTITEARLYMSLYKNFQTEIDDNYMKYSMVLESESPEKSVHYGMLNSEQTQQI